MPEGSVGISEFRTSTPPTRSIDEASTTPNEGPKSKPSLIQRIKDVVSRRVLSEQLFRPEDYSESQIASDILTFTRSPLREKAGLDPYANGFNKRDILSNKGQALSMGKPNSPAYRAVSQALEQLVREGALEAAYDEESLHGEHRNYRVKEPKLLQEVAERTNQQ